MMNRLMEWIRDVGKDRTLFECLAVYFLVSCGGWFALTINNLLTPELSNYHAFLYAIISMAKGWLGLKFMSEMKRDIKDD